MITALVERWRLVTHIFHLSVGKLTITLHDVVILNDLPVSGRAIISPNSSHTRERIHRMFQVLPPNEAMIRSSVKLTWMLISGYLIFNKFKNEMQGILLELVNQD